MKYWVNIYLTSNFDISSDDHKWSNKYKALRNFRIFGDRIKYLGAIEVDTENGIDLKKELLKTSIPNEECEYLDHEELSDSYGPY